MTAEHDALRALGLTDYGARAYETLLALGPAPAADVAAASRVPRTKIYAVLGELARRKWVRVDEGRPRRYRARAPRECFERERAALNERLDAALPSLEAQHEERGTRFAGPLWALRGMSAVEDRTLQMIARARRDVLVVAGFPLPNDARDVARALRAVVRRGVRVRVVVPDEDSPQARAFAGAGVELRVLALPPRVIVVDGQQLMTAFPIVRDDGELDCKAVWNPSPEFGEVVSEGLAHIWELAAPVGLAPAKPRRAPESARRKK